MNDEHLLGIAELDAQHGEITAMVDALRAVLAGKDRRHLVHPTLKRLSQLLKTHFEYEERLMQMVSYPELPHHQKVHAGILKLFDHYFENPPASGDHDDLGRLVSDKVLGHVMEHDARMTDMVRDYLKTFRSAPLARV